MKTKILKKHREEYLEYLTNVQLSHQKEPKESYIDWSGLEILCFNDWLNKRYNKK
jgi:hypothetical protein